MPINGTNVHEIPQNETFFSQAFFTVVNDHDICKKYKALA